MGNASKKLGSSFGRAFSPDQAAIAAKVGMAGVALAGTAVAGAVLVPVQAPEPFVLQETQAPALTSSAPVEAETPIEVDLEQLAEGLRVIAGQEEIVQAEPDPSQDTQAPVATTQSTGGVNWRYLGSLVHPGGRSALIHTGRQQMIVTEGEVRKDDATRADVELVSVDDEKMVLRINGREREVKRAERSGSGVGVAAFATNQASPQPAGQGLTPAQREFNEAIGVDPVQARELARDRIERARQRQEQLRERREAAERLRNQGGDD